MFAYPELKEALISVLGPEKLEQILSFLDFHFEDRFYIANLGFVDQLKYYILDIVVPAIDLDTENGMMLYLDLAKLRESLGVPMAFNLHFFEEPDPPVVVKRLLA